MRHLALAAALEQLDERGLDGFDLAQVAEAAGLPVSEVVRWFPSAGSVGMALYERLADALADQAPDLPAGTMAQRFEAAMHCKLAAMNPHRKALRSLAAKALDPTDRLGVLGPRTALVRSRVSAVFAMVVLGSTDGPRGAEEAARMGRLLYGLHLVLVGLWTQDLTDDNPRTLAAMELMGKVIGGWSMLRFVPGSGKLLARTDEIFGDQLATAWGADREARATAVLDRLFARRRLLEPCSKPSDAALALHRPKVLRAMGREEPLVLVLPAFPAKSPSPAKTLGPLPCMAEHVALSNLAALAAELEEAHPPGVKILLCSDGHVFADLVGVSDEHVTAYNEAIRHYVDERNLHSIELVGLADLFGERTFDEARAILLERYAMPLDEVKSRAARAKRHRVMADGIHRFLFEDAVVLDPSVSRTQHRKRTAERAYEVVQRSDAWGRLVADVYPDAVRLSIHPQPEVSDKIGMHLLDTDDAWLTPWHGVALVSQESVQLVKRKQAEELGADLVMVDGRPSHFAL